jgi:predicted HicB family RNase H-like nuclease
MAQFKLRIDDDLYQKAKSAAKTQERSLNWWITNLIRQAVHQSNPTIPQEQQ